MGLVQERRSSGSYLSDVYNLNLSPYAAWSGGSAQGLLAGVGASPPLLGPTGYHPQGFEMYRQNDTEEQRGARRLLLRLQGHRSSLLICPRRFLGATPGRQGPHPEGQGL